jgi:integrase
MATVQQSHKRLTAHYVNGKFYAFKSMIGGRRFYFGSKYGISADSDSDNKKALKALAAFKAEYDRLIMQGLSDWTAEAELRAEGMARALLFGSPLPTQAPSPSADPTEAQKPASKPTSPSAKGYTIHQAIDEFIAEQKKRTGLDEDTKAGYEKDMQLIKKAITDIEVSAIGKTQLNAYIDYWRNRPITYKGTPTSIQTVCNRIGNLRMLFNWLYAKDAPNWDGYKNYQSDLRIKKDDLERKYETTAERSQRRKAAKEAENGQAANHYTLDELSAIYANASDRMKLYILLALNCGMGAKEQSKLLKVDVEVGTKDVDNRSVYYGVIDRERNKTGIHAKWELWAETAQLLASVMAEQDMTDSMKRMAGIESKKDKPQYAKPEDTEYFALLTEDGYPLVHRGGEKNAKCDSIAMSYRKLLKRQGVEGKIRKGLSFYDLRHTAGQMIRDIGGYDTHKVFLAHSTMEASGRKSTSEKHYTERSQADFDKVATALIAMRQKLQPMFDARATNVVKRKRRANSVAKAQ